MGTEQTATAGPPSRIDTATPAHRLQVRVLAWGFTGADLEHAVDLATLGPRARHWTAASEDIERCREPHCPFVVGDPASLAYDRDEKLGHWAYAVYRVAGNA